MKNSRICFTLFVLIVTAQIFSSCASSPNRNNLSLQSAIRAVVDNMEQNLQQRPLVAVLSINSTSESLSAYIVEELIVTIAGSPHLTAVTRSQLELVRREQGFQHSGEVSDETARALGRWLGAQYVVTGDLVVIGNSTLLRVRAINVGTATISAASSLPIGRGDETIRHFLSVEAQQIAVAEESERQAAAARQRELQRHQRQIAWESRQSEAFINHIYLLRPYFQWDNYELLGGGVFSGVRFSPVPFTVTGIETWAGLVWEGGSSAWNGGATLPLGFVFPFFNGNMKLYSGGLLKVGNFGVMDGFLGRRSTVGFEASLFFFDDKFFVSYRGTWFENNRYTHSVSVGLVFLSFGPGWHNIHGILGWGL